MKITKAEDYAVTLVTALSRHYRKGFLSLHDIASIYGLPELFLKKIAHQLKAAGLLQVKEGRNGGYRLAKSPEDLTMEQVLRIFNPRPALTACAALNDKTKCSIYDFCSTRRTWESISTAFYSNLQHITFGELVKR